MRSSDRTASCRSGRPWRLEKVRLGATAYWRSPSLFWIASSDAALHAAAWAGLLLSAAALLGVTNAVVQLALGGLYFSLVQIGQIFYGYGWELQLLETGVLAIFLCPREERRALPRRAAADRGDLAPPLARLPRHDRRGAHQAPGRPLLARSHLPRLPLRDPAGAQPARVVPSPGAARGPRRAACS